MSASFEDPPRSKMYCTARCWFSFCINTFYSDWEVVGKNKFPKHGPVIVAANHTNSMVDATAVLHSSPRAVRLTCKDTLLEDPFWGYFVQGVESIPLRRRIDSSAGEKVDNREAMSALRKELQQGCCVGLFPEGVGRYRPYLSPLRTGAVRTAVDFVLDHYLSKNSFADDEKGALNFDFIHVLPLGISYFRREFFQSAACARFGEPIRVDANLLFEHGLDVSLLDSMSTEQLSDASYAVSKAITAQLRNRMEALIITATTWRIRVLAELAVDIAFPKLKRPPSRAGQFVSTARQFADIFDAVSDETPKGSAKETQTVVKCANLRRATVQKLSEYFAQLHSKSAPGICDETVGFYSKRIREGRFASVRSRCLGGVLTNGFKALLWSTVTLPGYVFWSPIFTLWPAIKNYRVKGGVEFGYDGVGPDKMAYFMFLTPFICSFYGLAFYRYIPSFYRYIPEGFVSSDKRVAKSIGFAYGVCPLLFYLYKKCAPHLMRNLKHLFSCTRGLVLSKTKWTQLCDLRCESEELLSEVVHKLEVSSDDVNGHLDETDKAEASGRSHALDWCQVLRHYDVPVDRFHIEQ